MRIHRLTMEGFGPFKAKQDIDFDVLSEDGIFMLEGPTGVGKSSIIDAIVFALYGKTAHEAATTSSDAKERIRSDYCGPTDVTKVTLEFTTGGNRYKVARYPAYEVPKVRGTGNKLENSKATLEFIHPIREGITQIKDVNQALNDILSMDAVLFSQMVVLPQGDFASFLHASGEDRRKRLEKIFKPFFYEKVMKNVKKVISDLDGELNKLTSEITRHTKNLQQIAAPDTRQEDMVVSEISLEEIVSPEVEDSEELGEQIDLDKLGKKINDFNVTEDEQLKSLDALISEVTPPSLDSSAEATLRSQIDDLERRKRDLKSQIGHIQRKTELEEEKQQLLSNTDIETYRSQLAQINRLSPMKDHFSNLSNAKDKQIRTISQIPESFRDLSLEQAHERLELLNGSLPGLESARDDAHTLDSQLKELERTLKEALESEKARDDLSTLKTTWDQAKDALTLAKTALDEGDERVRNNAISHIVQLLQPDSPCPVCGSTVHPNPAAYGDFDPEELKLLRANYERQIRVESEAKSAYNRALELSQREHTPSVTIKSQINDLGEIDFEAKDAELGRVRQTIQDLTRWLPLIQEFHTHTTTIDNCNQEIEKILTELQMTLEDAEDYLALDRGVIENVVTKYDEDVTRIETLLEQEIYKNLPLLEEASSSLGSVELQLIAPSEELRKIQDDNAQRQLLLEQIGNAKKGITEAIRNYRDLKRNNESYINLDNWFNGENTPKLSLLNFVLQERLEMILEYASRHLRKMSGGKYEFRLSSNKQNREQQTGLNIVIMDYLAGKERPAQTLSGGETFYSSLALALGLVEVVKASNGGIELGTLFIDEGFGSLSDDTLDEVLDVLDDLRAERVIGIISHVEGMKNQIPTRLEVRSTEDGPSTVRMAVKDAS